MFSSLKCNLSAGSPALKSENMEDSLVIVMFIILPCLALNCHKDEKHMFFALCIGTIRLVARPGL